MRGAQEGAGRCVGPPRYVTSSFSFASAVKGFPSSAGLANTERCVSEAASGPRAPASATAEAARGEAAAGTNTDSEPAPPAGGSRRTAGVGGVRAVGRSGRKARENLEGKVRRTGAETAAAGKEGERSRSLAIYHAYVRGMAPVGLLLM